MAVFCENFVFRKEWYDIMDYALKSDKDKLDFLMYIIENGCLIEDDGRKSNPSDYVKGVAAHILFEIDDTRETTGIIQFKYRRGELDNKDSALAQFFKLLGDKYDN